MVACSPAKGLEAGKDVTGGMMLFLEAEFMELKFSSMDKTPFKRF